MADGCPAGRNICQACVEEVASRQWGNLTSAQLQRCGLSRSAISRATKAKRLVEVLYGVYSVGHRSPAPEAFWQAVLLAYGDDSVLSRWVSIALHGLGPASGAATVAVPGQARRQRGVIPHSSMPFERGEVVIRKGLRTTSIERTLLVLAAIGEPVERLVAGAVAKRLTSIAKLQAYVERRSGARGVRGLRRCIEGRQTRSLVEKEFARWLDDRGFEPPRFNEPFGPFTLDAVWPTAGLIVEIDTYETHGTRHSFEADRRRDAYTASHGLRTIRVTPARWRDDGRRLARDLCRALSHA
jgi:very-short-patch-repair endonuclease